MRIYISGISGTGMGPLALMAQNAGLEVVGSDLLAGPVAAELEDRDINFQIGPQDGHFLQQQIEQGIDWFVYTSALPSDHPELTLAREQDIKCTKRDELIAYLVQELQLKMVAIAGTHGKTTTTAMLIWGAQQLNLPVSYLVGSTLPFAPAGSYNQNAKYLIYEADEYDRNFLAFHPWLAAITVATYDHPDIYPTEEDYQSAFKQFESQSQQVLHGGQTDSRLTLAGAARREDATTALRALQLIAQDAGLPFDEAKAIDILNHFPGVGRRFERLKDGLYSDYAHHPEEITATLEIAQEEARNTGKKGVVAIYEPHQNSRQYQVRQGYHGAFQKADHLFWLPTYLTREDPSLAVIQPADFIQSLDNSAIAEPADLNGELLQKLQQYYQDGYLILLMTAGPADQWLRDNML